MFLGMGNLGQRLIILANMNNNKSTHIVRQFLQEYLFRGLNHKIELKQIEKRMVRRAPKIVTKNVLSSLVDSSIKNSNLADQNISRRVVLQESHQQLKVPEQLKVPTKKKYSFRDNSQHQMPQIVKSTLSNNNSLKSQSRRGSQSTGLIKLVEQEQEESNQIKQSRKMKMLQQMYERQKELNLQHNTKNRELSISEKKSSLSECIYHHTYDYHTNIMKIDQTERQNFAENEQQLSLLQKIKQSLDSQLESKKMQEKLARIQEENEKHKRKVPLNKIVKVQQALNKPPEETHDKELILKKLKPEFKFQSSQIKSLSKDIESYLSEGIRLITHQKKLIQQKQTKAYQIKEQKIVKQKQRKKKEKTLTSQSLIYTYQKNQRIVPRGVSIIQNEENSLHQYQYYGDYNSLQFEKDNKSENYEALTERLVKHSKKYTIDSHYDKSQLRLPALEKYQQKKNFRKRNPTEQKVIKGLDSIEVSIRTPNNKALFHRKQRQGYFSALAKNKRTESSLEEINLQKADSSRVDSRLKKQAVKQYFSNYKQQFRHRIRSISEAIKLYS